MIAPCFLARLPPADRSGGLISGSPLLTAGVALGVCGADPEAVGPQALRRDRRPRGQAATRTEEQTTRPGKRGTTPTGRGGEPLAAPGGVRRTRQGGEKGRPKG